jgi:transposase
MPRQRYTTEQIINKLRQAEVLLSHGQSIREVAKELVISDHTYYRRLRRRDWDPSPNRCLWD